MPQALIVVAEWVGSAVLSSLPADIGTATAIAVANAAVVATYAVEVIAIAELTKALSPKVGGNYGTQVDFKADPRAGIPYLVGRTGTAGNIVFADTAGQNNNDLTYAVVLSGAGPVQAIESFTANATAVPFSGGAATGFYAGKMWQQQQLGHTPEAAAMSWPSGPALPPEWSAAHKLSGLAAVLWGLRFDTKIYSAGTPKPIWVVQGVKVYDPRLDSTYPGGAGPQRMGDETTWAYSENPYLHALTWCIGRHQNGQRVMGIGAPASAIDVAAFVNGANVAAANGWKTGGVIYSTDDKYQVLSALLQAGGGKPMRLGAKISCIVSAPRVSLATVTRTDVVGDVAVAAGISRRDRINTVWPEYRDETQDWQLVTADQAITVDDYYPADKGQRSRQVSYPLVQDINQVAQLARYDIENSREFTPVTVPCKPIWLGYKPGDCITADEPEWGLNGQKMLILQRQIDPATMQVLLTLCSETDGKHAFALGQTGVAPPTPGITGVDPSVPPIPSNGSWTATGGAITGADGTSMPAVLFTGSAAGSGAASVIAEWRLVLNLAAGQYGDWVSSEQPASITRIEAYPLLPQAQYHCRIRYRSARNVEDPAVAFDLGLVTTAGASISALTTIGGQTAQQIVDGMTTNTDSILSEILRGASYRSATDALLYINGTPVGTTIQQIKEQFVDGPTSYAAMLNVLGAMNTDGTAVLLNGGSVLVSPGLTLSTFVNSVSTTVGGSTVTITDLVQAQDGTHGTALLSIDNNGHISGYNITSDPGGSQFNILSNRFAFVDPGGAGTPIIILGYQDGKWTFNADVYAQNFIAGSIQTDHLVGGAITGSDLLSTSYGSVVGNSAVQVASKTHDTIVGGASHLIAVKLYLAPVGTTRVGAEVELKRNGISLGVDNKALDQGFAESLVTLFYDQPGVGTNTYTVEVSTLNSGAQVTPGEVTMNITEYKR